VRDMLVAEGFETSMSFVRRSRTLIVYSNKRRVWNFILWGKFPQQTDLADLVRKANGVVQPG